MLARLRALAPNRPITLDEALQLAELQANRLLELSGGPVVPVPTSIITDQPRIRLEHDPDLPAHAASGCSDWDSHRRSWVISLNPTEPRRRQRFTVLHEYKHILDHPGVRIRPANTPSSGLQPKSWPTTSLVASSSPNGHLLPPTTTASNSRPILPNCSTYPGKPSKSGSCKSA